MSLYITRQINTPEKRAFWALACALFSAFLLYAYLVQLTIHVIVERADTIRDAKQLTMELGELESENNQLRKIITYAYARRLGFQEAQEQTFAKRTRLASVE